MSRFPEQELLAYAESDPVKERAAILRQAVEAWQELQARYLEEKAAWRASQACTHRFVSIGTGGGHCFECGAAIHA